MEPRLKTSTQWTPFPEELCQHCVQVLEERFAPDYELEGAQFVVEGRIYANEIIGRFGLAIADQLKQPNFEISIDFDGEKEKALNLIHQAMDVVEHLWEEFLEEELDDEDLSRQWQSLLLGDKAYFYRYSTVNTNLEQEADRLLNQLEKRLVYGEASLEDEELDTDSESSDKVLH